MIILHLKLHNLYNFDPEGQEFYEKDKNNSHNSVVTNIDLEVNKMLIERVKQNYIDYGVLGEELSYNIDNKNLFVVDPIDGTFTYMLGLPDFCFSLALVKKGEPIGGIISDPILNLTLIAKKGQGTYYLEKNKRIKVDSSSILKQKLVHWDWSMNNIKVINNIIKNDAYLSPTYSISRVAQLIAMGKCVGCFFMGKGAHDIAAVKIIIEEAGGKVTDINGNEQKYDREINGALLSNRVLHRKLLSWLIENDK
jgi:fructose-1,6-bisphosphatase/inositol monophosphatase family enzyme